MQSAHLRGFAHRFGELLRGLRQQLTRNRVLCYICVHHEHRHDCNGETGSTYCKIVQGRRTNAFGNVSRCEPWLNTASNHDASSTSCRLP